MTPSSAFRLLLASALCGLFFGNFLSLSFLFFASLFIGVAGVFLFFIWKKFWIFVFSLFLLSFSWSQFCFQKNTYSSPSSFFDREMSFFEGTVLKKEKITQNKDIFSVFIHTRNGKTFPLKILLAVPQNSLPLFPGDSFSFEDTVSRFPPVSLFGRRDSLLAKGFVGSVTISDSELPSVSLSPKKHAFFSFFSEVQNFLFDSLEKTLPLSHASVGEGLLFGKKEKLPPTLIEQFRASGLIHLLVASGFNVSILLFFVAVFFQKTGRIAIVCFSLLFLLLYLFLTPLEIPILRATFMGGFALLGKLLGRESDGKNALLFSAFLLCVLSPSLLRFDVSFLLSFCATAGIVLLSPSITNFLSFLPEKFHIRELLSISFSAQISVLPILGIFFGFFPVAGILSNLFADPLIPLCILSLLLIFVGQIFLFFPLISQIFAIPAFFFLELLLQIAGFFSQIPSLALSFSVSIAFAILLFVVFLFFLFSSPPSNFFLQKILNFSKIS